MSRIHALVHGQGYQPPPLYVCPVCRRRYQLTLVPGSNTSVIRKHLIITPLVTEAATCPGSLRRPLEGHSAVIHYMPPPHPGMPPSAVLACCGQRPGEVPVFDTFTSTSNAVTCRPAAT